MDCIVCARAGGYNRAVVDVASGTVTGGFCRNCELDLFSDRLDAMPVQESSGCAFCDREGVYALPKWVPETTVRGDVVTNDVEFSVTETTVLLCAAHYDRLDGIREEPAELSVIELLTGED